MTKKFVNTLLLFLISFSSFAQFAAFGIQENKILERTNAKEMVSILVKGNSTNIAKQARKYDATIKISIQDLHAISIAKENLDLFTASLENVQIELPTAKGHLMMDTALIVNNIANVHAGLSPLPQAYTGKNVVVGILDSGIYFDHPDFKNADGTTRLRYIWDQNVSGGSSAPLPYGYGAEWSWLDIDNGTCNHVEPASQFGHGTNVAGAASGNGMGNGTNTGIAPDAEIIAVAVDYYGTDFLTKIVDAVDYVFKKADALGKPCVINISLGTYSGSHDGKDLSAQLIDALIEEKPGRAVVAAAGNGNNINDAVSSYISTHLSYNVSNDTSFTWFRPIAAQSVVYFELWADKADFENVSFAFQNDNATDFTSYGRTKFLSLKNDFDIDLSQGVFHTEFAFGQNNLSFGKVDYFFEEIDGRIHAEFLITPDSTQHSWRFMTTGSGVFDVWSSIRFQGTSNMVSKNLPPSFVVPEIANYKLPDNKKTVVSSFQCSDKVITVGNYSNKATYFDVDTILRFTNETPGEIFHSSSEGPTRDNRLKPDISATGNQIFAVGNFDFINSALAVNRPKVAPGALHSRNGGTSMASPLVAGAVALYMEENPDAYWYETKEAIIQSAKKDTFTGPVANTQYGHGKLDGFNLLQFDAVLGCTDTAAFNYNINANVDDGSCEAKILGCIDATAFNYNENANTDDGSCIAVVVGCTDSAALNFDQNANTDDGNCEYETGINDLQFSPIKIVPNPISNASFVYYESNEQANLAIYNAIGKLIAKGIISNQKPYKISKKNFTKGIYYIEIENANNSSEHIKFVVD